MTTLGWGATGVRNLSQNSLQEFELTYSGTTSLFTAQQQITGAGDYLVILDAQQISIRNGGLGQVSFTLRSKSS